MNFKKFVTSSVITPFKECFCRKAKISYSQKGEDLIVNFIFRVLRINKPTYLDIGAHHPIFLSNTYLFYKNGSKGVCIEPNHELYKIFKRKRKRDICLNIGVGTEKNALADFYILNTKVLSTFSKEEAEHLVNTTNKKIEKVIKIPLIPINEIIKKYFNGKTPNFVSLDTEGYDFKILKSIDFKKFRPEVICVETLTYSENKNERKETEIIDLMIKNDYYIHADTYINTIFVDKNKWLSR